MKFIGFFLVLTTVVFASGWKTSEQSVNSTALSGAYVANTTSADTAYFNPANMAFIDEFSHYEVDISYLGISSIDYEGTVYNSNAGTYNDSSASSQPEAFILPTLFYVSDGYGKLRFGLSLVSPMNYSKRWEDEKYSILSSKQSTLHAYEINPVLSYKINDKLAVAAGIRVVYGIGAWKNNGTVFIEQEVVGSSPTLSFENVYQTIDRDMKADGFGFGFNMALSYRPSEAWMISSTYRSNIDLNLEGDTSLSSTAGVFSNGSPSTVAPAESYEGTANVKIPLPATLTLATAYTLDKVTTFELVFERTFWSAYSDLNFEGYTPALVEGEILESSFDNPVSKNWEDSNTYRIGITHIFNKRWLVMAGYAYDESPVPNETLNFDMPEGDTEMVSFGLRYHYSNKMSIGLAGQYRQQKAIDVSSDSMYALDGTFSDTSAYMMSLGVEYAY